MLNFQSTGSNSFLAVWGQHAAILGFFLYAAMAPHSIAGAEIALAIAGVGWLVRTIATRTLGIHHTRPDLPILLFVITTIASSFLSEEPRISIAKLPSVCVVALFYLTQAIITRFTAIVLVCLMIVSGLAGTLFSVFDLLRGRGVVVESIARDSPLRELHITTGDAIWRIGGQRVYSRIAIDDAIKAAPSGKNLLVSVISRGEHVERGGLVVTEQLKKSDSPSGITGRYPTHRFRASGWTRHYGTFSEILQIIAQLALGLALANFQNHGANLRFKLAITAASLLALGIALTAMRTVLVAFAIGVAVITWRAAKRKARFIVPAALTLLLAFGAFVVARTRAEHALWLQDSSAFLRLAVARAGMSRIMLHPFLGHGMDAMKLHWNEWGFPGADILHLHSTPLQLAFDRGLPSLALWVWIMATFWLFAAGAERASRNSEDTTRHGLLLGATGALAGFFASSLVNYNFGDEEVALVFWWLMGIVVLLGSDHVREVLARASKPPVTKDKANQGEGAEVSETGPVGRRPFKQDPPIASN